MIIAMGLFYYYLWIRYTVCVMDVNKITSPTTLHRRVSSPSAIHTKVYHDRRLQTMVMILGRVCGGLVGRVL